MLRQRPTQITLDRSDALWHTENLDKRKTERASKKPAQAPTTLATQPSVIEGQTTVLPYGFPNPPSAVEPGSKEKPADDSIISKEPIPRYSRAYWADVVASAVDRPTPDHDRESDDTDSGSTHSGGILSTYADIDDHKQSHAASTATEQGSEDRDNPELRSQLGDNVHPSILKRHAIPFRFQLRSRKRSRGEGSLESPFQQGLDGVSDTLPILPRRWVHTVELDYERGMQYTGESSYYASESSISSYGISDSGPIMYTSDRNRYPSGGLDEEITPRPISNHRSMEQLQRHSSGSRAIDLSQRRSSGLPRSSLHISQSAISSSPEKSVITPAKIPVGEGSGLLSQPPRRRINYRPRTDTYSYEESEASSDSELHHHSNLPTNDTSGSITIVHPASPHSGAFEVYRSYPFQNLSPRQVSNDHSTTSSIHMPSPIRNTRSQYLVPSGLPPPFSATPRRVSQNPVVQISSSRNPFSTPMYSPSASISTSSSPSLPRSSSHFTAPPNRTYPIGDLPIRTRNLSPYAGEYVHGNPFNTPPRQRQANSSSPMAPRTPPRSMRVYNDNLPRASQPQTPYQLPRHGIPIPNAYYTAPPRVSSFQSAYRRLTPLLNPTARVAEREHVRTEVAPPRWPEAWRSTQDQVGNLVALAAEQDVNGGGEGLVVTREQRSNPVQVSIGRRRESDFWRSRRGEGFWEGQENVESAGSDVRGDEGDGEDGLRGLDWIG